jgi:transposase
VKQQKCVAHILRSIRDVVETKRGKARWFGQRLKALLKESLQAWHDYHDGKRSGSPARVAELQAAVTRHLRPRRLRDRDNQRLLDELGRHHARGNLLRFLEDPTIEPTNNRAERALRPAVIARKVSQCSKTEEGAEAFSAFTSVIRTLVKTGADTVERLCQIFRGPKAREAPA